ncbi:hypothetical protein Tco_0538231 [Tanacetum coccineum]
MEGLIDDDNDDESRYELKKQWNIYDNTNHDHEHEIDHEADEREELCEIHELPICNMRRFKMIKYSFEQNEEYVAIKEDEYDDLARTSDDACRAYQEIFRIMDVGSYWILVEMDGDDVKEDRVMMDCEVADQLVEREKINSRCVVENVLKRCGGSLVENVGNIRFKDEEDEDKDEIKGLIWVYNHIANKRGKSGHM